MTEQRCERSGAALHPQDGACGRPEDGPDPELAVTSSPLPATAAAPRSPQEPRAASIQRLPRKTHFWPRVSGRLPQVLVSRADTLPGHAGRVAPGQGPSRSPVGVRSRLHSLPGEGLACSASAGFARSQSHGPHTGCPAFSRLRAQLPTRRTEPRPSWRPHDWSARVATRPAHNASLRTASAVQGAALGDTHQSCPHSSKFLWRIILHMGACTHTHTHTYVCASA